jgi:hypothetical protein
MNTGKFIKMESITVNPNLEAIYDGDIPDAISECYRCKEQVLRAISGNPSTTEVASWDAKVFAAQGVKTSGGPTPIILTKDNIKYGSLDAAVAIILMRSRLYTLTKTGVDILFDAAKAKLETATNQTGLQTIRDNFCADLAAIHTEILTVRDAVQAGDMSRLDAAETALLAQAK